MFCQNCGTQLEEGTKFCPNCGSPVVAPEPIRETPIVEEPTVAAPVFEKPEAPVYQQPTAPVYQQPVQQPVVTSNPEANALSTPILIFGILGIAFASMPYLISILGIVFSAIAKGKVKAFQAAGGVLSGKAKVGSILAKVGMIVAIIMTVLFAIVIIALIIAAVSQSGSTHYYY